VIISNKVLTVFDVEITPNVFIVSTIDSETNVITTYEISKRQNDITKIYNKFIQNNIYFVGYNCIHYDTILINALLYDYEHTGLNDYIYLTNLIYTLSNQIINNNITDSYKLYKYANYFSQIDLLTMLYSTALRVSLKWLQVTMHYNNVLESPINWHTITNVDDIDTLIHYNLNDIKSTLHLLQMCEKDLELRQDIERKYGIQCLSMNSVDIGKTILLNKYCEYVNIPKHEIETMRSPAPVVDLRDIIIPTISLTSGEFKSIQQDMLSQRIADGRGVLTYEVIYNKLKYSIGVGGLHSINLPGIIKPKDDEVMISADISSYYPSMIIQHDCIPRHLGKAFLKIYTEIRNQRVAAKKKGDKVEAETLKLTINSTSGLYGSEFSWLYDPKAVLKIRINGQLFLLMLIERLTQAGMRVISANTDGIETIIPKKLIDRYYEICKQWESETKLELEYVEYEKIIFHAVNDYIAIKKTQNTNQNEKQIKQKGLFIDRVVLGKGLSPTIIPKALTNYFVYNIPIKDTIYKCEDIKAFLIGEKTGKQFITYYGDDKVQRVNRFYVTNKDGKYLHKCKKLPNGTESCTKMCRKPIQILNEFKNEKFKNYNVDHTYYLYETQKIIDEIEPKQLSFFTDL
jgi:hypothetical protein